MLLTYFHKLSEFDPQYSTYARLREAYQSVGANPVHVVGPWYAEVYEERAYVPPLAGLVLGHAPLPVHVVVPSSGPPLIPRTELCHAAVRRIVDEQPNTKEKLYEGLKRLRRLPWTHWVQLAIADYDTALDNFRANRPAYHLVLWHTLQVAEKVLKAVLAGEGVPLVDLENARHSLGKLQNMLAGKGVLFSANAKACLARIVDVADAGSRYENDSSIEKRQKLKEDALRAHHELLMFFYYEGDGIWARLSISPELEGNEGVRQLEVFSNYAMALDSYVRLVESDN